MKKQNWISIGIALAVLVALLAYLAIAHGKALEVDALNESLAIGSVFLMGASFLLGPLSRVSEWFAQRVEYRAQLGVWGFLFAAAHIAIVLAVPRYKPFLDLNSTSIIFGVIAFAIFAFMAATGTRTAIRALGFERWKQMQRAGYLAFILTIVHFGLLEAREFGELSSAQAPPAVFIALLFALAVLAARIVTLALPRPKKKR